MITKKEITTLNLSPTKKDFVQIWNELLDVASKLSERWDPVSTNESDPGIVLLKALTGIADKLNYNIDKNTLEAYMPTAAQEESMRKLCDMLGYNIKYYRSAKTEVNIKYYNSDPSDEEAAAISGGLLIPKFMTITNSDQDISYFTINQTSYYISSTTPSRTITCLEGQIVKCESVNENNIITVNQISENNRFYLPETKIAENGIFIYNIFLNSDNSLEDGTAWEKVDNLNTQIPGSRVYKFGYDSFENRPYIEFPEDYSELFEEGIFIYYTRTNGINGNISAHTLTQIETPNIGNWDKVSAESFSVDNPFAANTGANIETIKQAYNNFKKTIGTFDTLVTCRDYMNKIYNMVDSDDKPYVSNILVTDIRNDINKAITICSCDDAGIFYKEKAITTPIQTLFNEVNKPVFSDNKWYSGYPGGAVLTQEKLFESAPTDFDKDVGSYDVKVKSVNGASKKYYWEIIKNSADGTDSKSFLTKIEAQPILTEGLNIESPKIDHFDLILYPFKRYNQIKSDVKNIRTAYDASFKYTSEKFSEIKYNLENSSKNVSHNIKRPEIGDIVSINNYLRLNATITTNAKLTIEEGSFIIENIKIALANAFNMRELDFGEAIPFDSIIEVIEKSDARIRIASLNEPTLYTTYSVISAIKDNLPVVTEYAVASNWLDVETAKEINQLKVSEGEEGTFDTIKAKEIYNKLVLRNILAGRVPLFNYDNTFKTSYNERAFYKVTELENVDDDLKAKFGNLEQLNPYVVFSDNDTIYEGIYSEETGKYKYNKLEAEYKDNVLLSDDNNNNFVELSAECTVKASDDGAISDLLLDKGEFIRFRAPNFITTKTYPAYVNYNLYLGDYQIQEARAAQADTFYNILNTGSKEDGSDSGWAKAFSYFDKNNQDLIKTFKISQKISGFTRTDSTTENNSESLLNGDIIIDILPENTNITKFVDDIINSSGCMRIDNTYSNNGFVLSIEGTDIANNIVLNLKNPYITESNVIATIKDTIDKTISTLKSTESKKLPQNDWSVSLTFKYIPFNAETLSTWENFVKFVKNDYKVVIENETVFWRLFGEGYQEGKYITTEGKKLLSFGRDDNRFGLLPIKVMTGLYLASDLGQDSSPTVIKNGEEYRLKDKDVLYIEYTPSTAADDSTQSTASKTEVYYSGTIIRPNGFNVGLTDSRLMSNSAFKSVDFITEAGLEEVNMYSLGANEQIEIRDFAKVALSSESFKESGGVWLYKNFNNCPELEEYSYDEESKKRINNTYTLKDGEFIYYTDKNKNDAAFFASGTQIKLEGSTLFSSQYDIIDFGTIQDSGLDVIPWKFVSLANTNKITFTEYQYITLGDGDKLNTLELVNNKKSLNREWVDCKNVTYTLATDPEKTITLPTISVEASKSKGDGWEVCSLLELNTSPRDSQTLRQTDKIHTRVLLKSRNSLGNIIETCVPDIQNDETNQPDGTIQNDNYYSLSFKTNLTCYGNSDTISIKDVLVNPKKLSGFQLKVFKETRPLIVETVKNKTIPHKSGETLLTWSGEPIADKDYLDLWNHVDLESILVGKDSDTYDKALKLDICTTPNTYGAICFYVKYADTTAINNAKTWIEVLPGVSQDNISLINSEESFWGTSDEDKNKFYLHSGINCVRFNKTCTILIKSEEAKGTLFFDDMKLIKCATINKKIEDTDTNNTINVPLVTHGLNLAQLGYLKVDSAEYEEGAQKVLEQSFVTSTEKDLLEAKTDTKKIIDSLLYPLTKTELTKEKLELLKNDLQSITEDLDETNNTYTANSKNYNSYTLMVELLGFTNATNNEDKGNIGQEEYLLDKISKQKKSLLSQLNDLTTLTTNKASIEEEQTRLLLELTQLNKNVLDSISTLSDDELVEVFKDNNIPSRSTTAITEPFSEVLSIVSKKGEVYFTNYISELIERINKTVDQDSNSQLNSLLNQVVNNNSLVNKQISTKISLLKSYFDIEQITGTLFSAKQSALAGEYSDVAKQLRQVYSLLDTKEINTILNEIASISEDNQYLSDLINSLQVVIKDNSLLNGYEAAYNKALEGIKNPSSVKPTDLSDLIDAFEKKVVDGLKSKIDNILDEISNNLLLDDNTEQLIDSLTKSALDLEDKNQATILDVIIPEFNNLLNVRADFNEILKITDIDKFFDNNFNNNSNSLFQKFFAEAVLEIYPKKLKAEIEVLMRAVVMNFKTAITLEPTDESFSDSASESLGTAKQAYQNCIKKIFTVDMSKNPTKTLLDSHYNRFISDITSLNNEKALYIEVSEAIKVFWEPLKKDIKDTLDKYNIFVGDKKKNGKTHPLALLITHNNLVQEAGTAFIDATPENYFKALDNLEAVVMKNLDYDKKLLEQLQKIYCPGITALLTETNSSDPLYPMLKDLNQFIFKTLGLAYRNTLGDKKFYTVCTGLSKAFIGESEDKSESKGALGLFIALLSAAKDSKYQEITKLIGPGIKATPDEHNPQKYFDFLEYISSTELANECKKYLLCESLLANSCKNLNTLIDNAKTGSITDRRAEIWTRDILVDLLKPSLDNDDLRIETLSNLIVNTLVPVVLKINSLYQSGSVAVVEEKDKSLLQELIIEEQLLSALRSLDSDNEFYYTASIDSKLAIDFNDDVTSLMNPNIFYDINNINNNFVISKLDIDYLDTGIHLARSSRLN